MSFQEGRLAAPVAPTARFDPAIAGAAAVASAVPTVAGGILYSSMKHRTQLYLDEGQYRWLQQRAGKAGSIAAVVRELIDAERARLADPAADPLLRFLVEDAPGRGRAGTSVTTLDRDVYGS